MDRARKSGYVLADILMERVQGHRPTTLIGYSTGAVVIWECLLELAKRKEHGLINSGMILMLTFQCNGFLFHDPHLDMTENRLTNNELLALSPSLCHTKCYEN